jgi:hypothetical protein
MANSQRLAEYVKQPAVRGGGIRGDPVASCNFHVRQLTCRQSAQVGWPSRGLAAKPATIGAQS